MAFLANFFVFVAVALLTGLGSAWYMISAGSALTTRHLGPWTTWTTAGHVEADPYTRAHVARSGRLPLTSANARYYFAAADSDGDKLSAHCEYEIIGRGPDAQWWSLAIYDGNGRLMANPANRYAFNSENVMRDTRGFYRIVLAREARPQNWLPVSGDHRVSLMLRTYGIDLVDNRVDAEAEALQLPVIRRLQCG